MPLCKMTIMAVVIKFHTSEGCINISLLRWILYIFDHDSTHSIEKYALLCSFGLGSTSTHFGHVLITVVKLDTRQPYNDKKKKTPSTCMSVFNIYGFFCVLVYFLRSCGSVPVVASEQC